MLEKICHIGPALNVQGGISSVLLCYKKLFNLSDENFISSYNGSFVKSLPILIKVCLMLLFVPSKKMELYQIHTSSYGSFFRKYLISLCLRLRKRKYIVHVHGSMFDKFCNDASPLVKKFVRSYFRKASAIVVLSSEMETFLREFDGELNSFVTIPNPGENIAASPTMIESHQDPVKIVFSGRFGNRKGVFDLIKAFDIASFAQATELYLYGDGELERVQKAVAESPQKDCIKVSPWLPHKEYLKRLPDFDFLVLPSYAERFSMSLVEALGLGLPVVSTFVGGTAEVVEDGVCGVLCNPGDIRAIANALEKLANDKELRSRMGKAGWERARNCFSADVVRNKLEKLYAGLGVC